MYGPVANNVHFTFFIEEAATNDILVIGGAPFMGDLQGHDIIPCFPTQAMADQFVQLSVNDGQIQAGDWVVVTYPVDQDGRDKVVASGVAHFAGVLVVHPMNALAILTAGV
jgi:hypothetical protein